MKKPEEYKCHEIMLKYSNSHSHEDFLQDCEIIFKHEDIEKIFNDCGFTSYKRTGIAIFIIVKMVLQQMYDFGI